MPRIRLRCWGQLHNSVNTDVAALTGSAALDAAVATAALADGEVVLLTLLHTINTILYFNYQ